MNISKVASYLTEAVQNPKEQAQKAGSDNKAAQTNGVSSDRVELSRDYQDLAQAKKVEMSRDEIRTEKVDQIRSAVNNGTYRINPEGVAGKMIDEVI
jgi:flagellar biosynthesis anti-sigma factor FlgM